MSLNRLLSELSQRKVKLYLDGEQLGIRAPKGALTEELKQSLKEYKQDILKFLQRQQGGLKDKLPSLVSIARDDSLPLSLAQERIWLLEQSDSQSSVYNLSVAFRLTGALREDILEKSIAEIVQRHEVLRTRFKVLENLLVPVIDNDFTYHLPILNLSHIPSEKKAPEIEFLTTRTVQKPFNLTEDLLWRSQLIYLEDQEYILVLTMHHFISDGWSFGIFFRELSELYRAFSLGEKYSLSELSIQYVDFAHWQRQYLESEGIKSSLDYWKKHLSENLSPLKLPVDKQQSFAVTYKGEYQSFSLAKNLVEQIKLLSQKEGVSLFVTLLAVFEILLNRYSEQEDLLICSPVLGRNPAETEDLIGYFNNILLLRTNLAGNPTFREFLQRVRQVTTEAYEHQEIPFQWLAELPEVASIPLTRAMFNLDKATSDSINLQGVAVNPLEIHNGEANFDLSVTLFEKHGDNIRGIFNYKSALFSPTIITQMIERFQNLLETLVHNPDINLDSLEKWTISQFIVPEKLEKAPFIAPRDQLEEQLVSLWEDILGVKPIGIADNFFALGGHSILALRLFTKIENIYDKNLGLATLFQAPTIEQFANILRSDKNSMSWSSLVPIQPNGSFPPLFCFHAVGGNVLTYVELSRYLGSEQPVYALQARGLDGKTAFDTRIEDMASHYLEEILTVLPQGPYLFCGLSGGGVIAFEVAQQLQAKGKKVAFLALFDSYNPKYIRERALADQQYRQKQAQSSPVQYILFKIKKWKKSLRLHPLSVYKQKLSIFLSILPRLISLQEWHPILKKFNNQKDKLINQLDLLMYKLNPSSDKPLPYILRTRLVTKNVTNAVKSYIPQPYLGKITLFRVDASIYKSEEGLDNDELGWDEFAIGGLEIHRVPGDHSTLMMEPHVKVLAAKLKVLLESIAQKNAIKRESIR